MNKKLHIFGKPARRASLKEEGFALYEYDCPIFAGNTQAVADVSTMGRPTQIHDLTTLF